MGDRPRTGRGWRIAGGVVAAIVVLALIVPLLWPVPPLENTVAAETLADADSLFIEIDGLSVHYKTWGMPSASSTATADTALVLLHGFGASTFTWHAVAEELSGTLPVVAFDRPGFGLTGRPLEWSGPDPYSPDTQADLTIALMDELGIERAVLVGHSAGGTVAALVAARYPDRIAGVVLEDPAIYAGGAPAFLAPLFRTPQFRRIGPLIVRRLGSQAGTDFIQTAWHDPSRIPPSTYEGYRKPLRVNDWDKALWQLTIASRPTDIPDIVSTIRVPALFMTGDDDRVVPAEATRRAAKLVDGARLVTISACGHVPHEEQPEAFIEAVVNFAETDALAR